MKPSTLRLAEIERLRTEPGRSLLLFITDRCPVGCGHCSVDSRPDSPTIRDYPAFAELIDAIAALPELRLVGISGGEPLMEREGLAIAVDKLARAGKSIVLYTSGFWARSARLDWTRDLISPASCVFLSTDAYHAEQLDGATFVAAARWVSSLGIHVIVQTLDLAEDVARARELLGSAFGSAVDDLAELSLVPPLPYGRAVGKVPRAVARGGREFGGCGALAAPVVRYDGTLIACCNEQVIVGLGPDRLRARPAAQDLGRAIVDFAADPVLRIVARDAGSLTEHPTFAGLGEKKFSGLCQFCWAAQAKVGPPDPLLGAMALLASGP